MSSKTSLVLAKSRLILDEMCRLYGKFASYLGRVLCKTRLIFPRINGPSVSPDETPRREYDAQRSIFDELRGVSSGQETLCLMLDIASQTK